MKSRGAAALLIGLVGAIAAGLPVTHAEGTDTTRSLPVSSTARIDGSDRYQTIAGFGVSESFLQARLLMGDSARVQHKALRLLFSRTSGAGLSILRNQIGSVDLYGTIEPTAPSSPTAQPDYAPLGDDDGQEWLAQTIHHRFGVDQFIADAFGAPPFMKTNDSDDNGGTLCGVPGTDCATGDWRQAYANYLVQYAKDYRADGLPLEYIDFENEANLSEPYTSMTMTPAQTANFAVVLGATLARSGLATKVACCDTEGWNYAHRYARAIEARRRASSDVKLFTSHGYTEAPDARLTGWSEPVWETEWSTFDTWDRAWDDGTDASGLTWAEHIYTGLTSGDLSAFLYWWGTDQYKDDNESLVRISGTTVTPSSRLWAFANFSRFVRPGAVRIGADTVDHRLDLTAFENADKSVAIVALNTGRAPVTVHYSLTGKGLPRDASATPYVTDATARTARQTSVPVSSGSFDATVQGHALVTYHLSG
jgi:O-glycosyl hydrolase